VQCNATCATESYLNSILKLIFFCLLLYILGHINVLYIPKAVPSCNRSRLFCGGTIYKNTTALISDAQPSLAAQVLQLQLITGYVLAVGVGVLLAADSQSTSKSGYRASLWDGQVPVFISSRNRVAQLYPRELQVRPVCSFYRFRTDSLKTTLVTSQLRHPLHSNGLLRIYRPTENPASNSVTVLLRSNVLLVTMEMKSTSCCIATGICRLSLSHITPPPQR
jgi:hypothetical protein